MNEECFEELPIHHDGDARYEVRQLHTLAEPTFAVVTTGKGPTIMEVRDVALVRLWTRDSGKRAGAFVSRDLILPVNRQEIGKDVPDPLFWPTSEDADFHGCFETREEARELVTKLATARG